MKPLTEEHLAIFRRHMVELVEMHFDLAGDELGERALDPALRRALIEVPRHLFVPMQLAAAAYQDTPLPIGFDKTLSQPFIGALMLDLLELTPGTRVLEVGTGLGYQTAVLARLARRVWSVEVVEEFALAAEVLLRELGGRGGGDVAVRVGDGSRGWAEHAPFDKILVAAAAEAVPSALVEQLKPGGRMVLPTGLPDDQKLTVVDKDKAGRTRLRELMPVRFSKLETVL
jgi:protein-L-isoaspartate(D-aspartate) O-methyltransferase